MSACFGIVAPMETEDSLLLPAVGGRPETESFNEDDCRFMEGHHEWQEGAFSHYSRRRALPDSDFHLQEQGISPDFDAVNGSACGLPMGLHFPPFSSHDERGLAHHTASAPSSPGANLNKKRTRKTLKSSLSVREALLAEAWERKRELMLNEEMAMPPELLGRSTSDCGNLDAPNTRCLRHELRRPRMRSLTDEDFEELRGCIDLGFRFDQSAVPELCDTLPALKVYCAVAQGLQESPSHMPLNSPVKDSPTWCSSPSPVHSWRVSSPGDDPKDVKGRLRHWAQAVACDARLCV